MDISRYRACWSIRPDTVYLNHGSFGPPPQPVREDRRRWQERQDQQPMDFCVRQWEPAWREARQRLARFVGAHPANLVFVDNATSGMNVVADSFPLGRDDEVLLTDHEYGAVERIWQRVCLAAGARLRVVSLPFPLRDQEELLETLFAAVNPRTRLIIVSHITSPTAVTLPVAPICREASGRDVAVCIDGPHAVAQLPLDLEALGCDYYTASCHKWLSAPFGSGFLWVHPRRQARIRPPQLSWGRLPPQPVSCWSDEFVWQGTRDPSPYFAVPAAIEFLEQVGLETFRQRTHQLAQVARNRLTELTGLEPLVPDDERWYGAMAHVPLPAGDARSLQAALWQQFGIEVPVIAWRDRRWIRVSCHLYNDEEDLDRLIGALHQLL